MATFGNKEVPLVNCGTSNVKQDTRGLDLDSCYLQFLDNNDEVIKSFVNRNLGQCVIEEESGVLSVIDQTMLENVQPNETVVVETHCLSITNPSKCRDMQVTSIRRQGSPTLQAAPGSWFNYSMLTQAGTTGFSPTVTIDNRDGTVTKSENYGALLDIQTGILLGCGETYTACYEAVFRVRTLGEPLNDALFNQNRIVPFNYSTQLLGKIC